VSAFEGLLEIGEDLFLPGPLLIQRLRRGQIDLLQWLNTFVYTIKNNGELDAISRKWRQLPLEVLPVF